MTQATLMSGYYALREAWEVTRESVTRGYPAECREYDARVPVVTFKRYLIETRGR